MFLNKVFKFLFGYVILSLRGVSIERFINICIRRGIRFISISKSEKHTAKVSVYMRDFKRLRSPAYKTRTAVHIEKKCGLPVLFKKYGRRYALAAGFVFAAVMIAVGSRYIWIVEYEGAQNVDRTRLEAVVQRLGVKVGARKSSLPSGNEMKMIILSGTDDLSWAWVYIKGARAVVSVRKKVMPPYVVPTDIPCDIVAVCDGVVKSVTAKTGKAYVKAGDAVSAGDVLIAGTLETEDGYRLVHATGNVSASVFRSASGEYPLCETVEKPNGENKMGLYITLFSREFKLFGSEDYSGYRISETDRHTDTPWGIFGIRTVHAEGIDVQTVRITPEEAQQNAVYELEERLSSTLEAGAVLINKKTDNEIMPNGNIKITVSGEFEQEIGTEKEIITK